MLLGICKLIIEYLLILIGINKHYYAQFSLPTASICLLNFSGVWIENKHEIPTYSTKNMNIKQRYPAKFTDDNW